MKFEKRKTRYFEYKIKSYAICYNFKIYYSHNIIILKSKFKKNQENLSRKIKI